MQFVFLVEEKSMYNTLNSLVPKILGSEADFRIIKHEGKQDLRKSIPIKLRAWTNDAAFIILHDKDSADCHILKRELSKLAGQYPQRKTLIRIVCTELESWFLGDFDALENAYRKNLAHVRNKSRFRNPDSLANAKEELSKFVPYQENSGSTRIAQFMDISRNSSRSFNVFVEGLRKFVVNVGLGVA